MPRIIGAHDMELLQIWVDASYAVHEDMRGHTGGVMSLGTGVFSVKSSKQKLNTKSSTETKVVGAGDYLPFTLWTIQFMAEQGHNIKHKHYFQDNQSAMRLEKNGLKSVGEKSRHIHIRYDIFITNAIKKEDITITHCPTQRMIADYFTKPLQGKLFTYMRDMIMGLSALPLEEHVGVKSTDSGTELEQTRVSTDLSKTLENKTGLTYVEVVQKGTNRQNVKSINIHV